MNDLIHHSSFIVHHFFRGALVTIYRVYVENGNRAGFWIQHRSWANTCAQVQSIAGQCEGKLPGTAPAYDSAAVMLRIFDVRSGRPICSDTPVDTADRHFTRIAEPCWRNSPEQRAIVRA